MFCIQITSDIFLSLMFGLTCIKLVDTYGLSWQCHTYLITQIIKTSMFPFILYDSICNIYLETYHDIVSRIFNLSYIR